MRETLSQTVSEARRFAGAPITVALSLPAVASSLAAFPTVSGFPAVAALPAVTLSLAALPPLAPLPAIPVLVNLYLHRETYHQ